MVESETDKKNKERMAEIRAKRKPPKLANVHPSVLELPDDDPFSLVSVRGWIKSNKEKLTGARQEEKSGMKGAIAKVAALDGYVRNMETYIRTGVWNDLFYGEHRNNKIRQSCIAMAYHEDGTPKRSVGVFYSDIGMTWQGEEAYEERMEELA